MTISVLLLFLFNISTLRAVNFCMRNQVGYLFDLIPFIYAARTGVSAMYFHLSMFQEYCTIWIVSGINFKSAV